MNRSIADLRREYMAAPLQEAEVQPDPILQFAHWFDQALTAGVVDVNAMTLATASPDGRPSARIVLLKDFDEHGFVFFTNYDSRKGRELVQNPWASLVFWWPELDRQVRIDGHVEKIPAEASVAYFQSRPRGSQVGAWASPQSQVIESRQALEARIAAMEERFEGQQVERPENWGGFRVAPVEIEFWQGRPSRLHDRLRYRRLDPDAWQLERLAP